MQTRWQRQTQIQLPYKTHTMPKVKLLGCLAGIIIFCCFRWIRIDFALLLALQKCQIHECFEILTFLVNVSIILPLLLSLLGLNSYCLLPMPMPKPTRICLCPCPPPMCGGRRAVRRVAGGAVHRGPSTWAGGMGAAHGMGIG